MAWHMALAALTHHLRAARGPESNTASPQHLSEEQDFRGFSRRGFDRVIDWPDVFAFLDTMFDWRSGRGLAVLRGCCVCGPAVPWCFVAAIVPLRTMGNDDIIRSRTFPVPSGGNRPAATVIFKYIPQFP